jgi:capsular polysaccharide biosynthesis protein
MEELSFIEQVNLMYTSSLVISIHGAGLTNINFLNSGSTVIELTPKLNDFNKFRFPYWRMSELLKLNYYCIFCDKEADEVYEDEYDSNLLIDLKKMEEVLEMAILNLKVNIFR